MAPHHLIIKRSVDSVLKSVEDLVETNFSETERALGWKLRFRNGDQAFIALFSFGLKFDSGDKEAFKIEVPKRRKDDGWMRHMINRIKYDLREDEKNTAYLDRLIIDEFGISAF